MEQEPEPTTPDSMVNPVGPIINVLLQQYSKEEKQHWAYLTTEVSESIIQGLQAFEPATRKQVRSLQHRFSRDYIALREKLQARKIHEEGSMEDPRRGELIDKIMRMQIEIWVVWSVQSALLMWIAQHYMEVHGERAFPQSVFEKVIEEYSETEGQDIQAMVSWLDTFKSSYMEGNSAVTWDLMNLDYDRPPEIWDAWRLKLNRILFDNRLMLSLDDAISETEKRLSGLISQLLTRYSEGLDFLNGKFLVCCIANAHGDLVDLMFRRRLYQRPVATGLPGSEVPQFDEQALTQFLSEDATMQKLDSCQASKRLQVYWLYSLLQLKSYNAICSGYLWHTLSFTSKIDPEVFIICGYWELAPFEPTKPPPWADSVLVENIKKFLQCLKRYVRSVENPTSKSKKSKKQNFVCALPEIGEPSSVSASVVAYECENVSKTVEETGPEPKKLLESHPAQEKGKPSTKGGKGKQISSMAGKGHIKTALVQLGLTSNAAHGKQEDSSQLPQQIFPLNSTSTAVSHTVDPVQQTPVELGPHGPKTKAGAIEAAIKPLQMKDFSIPNPVDNGEEGEIVESMEKMPHGISVQNKGQTKAEKKDESALLDALTGQSRAGILEATEAQGQLPASTAFGEDKSIFARDLGNSSGRLRSRNSSPSKTGIEKLNPLNFHQKKFNKGTKKIQQPHQLIAIDQRTPTTSLDKELPQNRSSGNEPSPQERVNKNEVTYSKEIPRPEAFDKKHKASFDRQNLETQGDSIESVDPREGIPTEKKLKYSAKARQDGNDMSETPNNGLITTVPSLMPLAVEGQLVEVVHTEIRSGKAMGSEESKSAVIEKSNTEHICSPRTPLIKAKDAPKKENLMETEFVHDSLCGQGESSDKGGKSINKNGSPSSHPRLPAGHEIIQSNIPEISISPPIPGARQRVSSGRKRASSWTSRPTPHEIVTENFHDINNFPALPGSKISTPSNQRYCSAETQEGHTNQANTHHISENSGGEKYDDLTTSSAGPAQDNEIDSLLRPSTHGEQGTELESTPKSLPSPPKFDEQRQAPPQKDTRGVQKDTQAVQQDITAVRQDARKIHQSTIGTQEAAAAQKHRTNDGLEFSKPTQRPLTLQHCQWAPPASRYLRLMFPEESVGFLPRDQSPPSTTRLGITELSDNWMASSLYDRLSTISVARRLQDLSPGAEHEIYEIPPIGYKRNQRSWHTHPITIAQPTLPSLSEQIPPSDPFWNQLPTLPLHNLWFLYRERLERKQQTQNAVSDRCLGKMPSADATHWFPKPSDDPTAPSTSDDADKTSSGKNNETRASKTVPCSGKTEANMKTNEFIHCRHQIISSDVCEHQDETPYNLVRKTANTMAPPLGSIRDWGNKEPGSFQK